MSINTKPKQSIRINTKPKQSIRINTKPKQSISYKTITLGMLKCQPVQK